MFIMCSATPSCVAKSGKGAVQKLPGSRLVGAPFKGKITEFDQIHSDVVAGQQACGQGAAGSGAWDGAAALLWPAGRGARHAPAAAAAAPAVPLPLHVRPMSCLDIDTFGILMTPQPLIYMHMSHLAFHCCCCSC